MLTASDLRMGRIPVTERQQKAPSLGSLLQEGMGHHGPMVPIPGRDENMKLAMFEPLKDDTQIASLSHAIHAI